MSDMLSLYLSVAHSFTEQSSQCDFHFRHMVGVPLLLDNVRACWVLGLGLEAVLLLPSELLRSTLHCNVIVMGNQMRVLLILGPTQTWMS